MRKVIIFNMVTLDGFIAGADGNIDWHRVDDEFNDFAIEQLNEAGGLIFGRLTYELMVGYWPTSVAIETDPIIAEKMNSIPKFVFSRTLNKTEWNNTRLVKGNIRDEILKLNQQPGGDLFIFGSANLAATLIQENLIDEYRLIVNPVVLGRGIPLFKDIQGPFQLDFQNVKPFRNGNVLLYYQAARS